ncbi:hypothetical protein F7725_019425, partial [Dissostichus mawsoni]
MEDETFTDISGKAISLSCQDHSSLCKEFVVSVPKVSIGKVMVYTCCVWLLAYAVFFFTENTAVLSSAIFITLVGMMLHIHFVKVDHETLLFIGSLGIQLSSSYASGRETTTFIEMGKIKDIVINEAIYMVRTFLQPMWVYALARRHQIIYYLCVLLKDPSEPNAVA